jgi:hypothetical protein
VGSESRDSCPFSKCQAFKSTAKEKELKKSSIVLLQILLFFTSTLLVKATIFLARELY